jgi:hypothetical protein
MTEYTYGILELKRKNVKMKETKITPYTYFLHLKAL